MIYTVACVCVMTNGSALELFHLYIILSITVQLFDTYPMTHNEENHSVHRPRTKINAREDPQKNQEVKASEKN